MEALCRYISVASISATVSRHDQQNHDSTHPLLLFLILPCSLCLRRPSHSLGSILALLAYCDKTISTLNPSQWPHPWSNSHRKQERIIRTLLPTRLLNFRRRPIPHEPIVGLKLLHHLVRIVDERETGALAAAILCPEAEAGDLVLVGFVQLCEFGAELVFRDVSAVGVEDVALVDERSVDVAIDTSCCNKHDGKRTRPSAFFLGGRFE